MSMSTFFGGFDMFVWIWSNAVFRLLLAERSAGTALKDMESCTKRQPGANFIFQTKDEKKETKILLFHLFRAGPKIAFCRLRCIQKIFWIVARHVKNARN